jgi:hypothetical protein
LECSGEIRHIKTRPLPSSLPSDGQRSANGLPWLQLVFNGTPPLGFWEEYCSTQDGLTVLFGICYLWLGAVLVLWLF